MPALIPPSLSSLPGANHTIYLDFTGHVTQNTPWNNYFNNPSINSPAYDIDGDPTSFNATELARIEEAWKRVAEDFIPFQVNVTTVDPGVEALRKTSTSDTQWGIRVVITSDTEGTGAGGIGYIDSFNWSTDTPVFVYVSSSGKAIAEAASHEVGHSLGLAHDGTASSGYYSGHGSGETSWAPIMGVGYYRTVTQWDRGEYYGSNNAGSGANYGKGPDDLAIITTYNGFGYRADDHGNNIASASSLTVTGGTNVSGSGIIERTTDLDYFKFTTGAGTVALSISPFTPGPNLDIKANLYNSSGVLVASSNSTNLLSASFNLTLAAGTYYLSIDGTGVGNPSANPPTGYSDYASLGRFFISGTIVDPGDGGGSNSGTLTVNDVTVNESAGTATFTVTFSGTLVSAATVNYATADDSAQAGSDYTAASGTLTFNPGETTKTVTVNITDDTLTEPTERFFLNLSGASAGITIQDGQGVATITDNDSTGVTISINDVVGKEGSSTRSNSYTYFYFTVSLSQATTKTIWVTATTQDGTARSTWAPGDPRDYVGGSVRLKFLPGQTKKIIRVSVARDTRAEPDETFKLVLSNAVNATIADREGLGVIVNDDGTPASGRAALDHGQAHPGGGAEVDLPHVDAFWYFLGFSDGFVVSEEDADPSWNAEDVGREATGLSQNASAPVAGFSVTSRTAPHGHVGLSGGFRLDALPGTAETYGSVGVTLPLFWQPLPAAYLPAHGTLAVMSPSDSAHDTGVTGSERRGIEEDAGEQVAEPRAAEEEEADESSTRTEEEPSAETSEFAGADLATFLALARAFGAGEERLADE